MPHTDQPASPPALEQSLRRYLALARSCHELFSLTLQSDRPAEHAAMDELLRTLQPGGRSSLTAMPPKDESARH